MDLVHETVSMKSVGYLTEFVRDHMSKRSRSSSVFVRSSPTSTNSPALAGAFDPREPATPPVAV